MYTADNIKSYYDDPERASAEEIESEKAIISQHHIVTKLLDGFPNAALLLNENRQIVAYNANIANIIESKEFKSIYGQRVGEAIGCIHSSEMPAGCGTSKFCEECGAGQCNKYTRETSLNSKQECRVIVNKNESEQSIDLRVSTSIIELDDRRYILFAIEDIQDEKRRKVLERIFFHDVLNTANSILGVSEVMNFTESPTELSELKELLHSSTDQLVKEIQSQRDLINAEQGTLAVNKTKIKVNEIIEKAYNIYKDHQISKNKNYILVKDKSDTEIVTDSILLIRSISNLLKNALEATDKNGLVKLFTKIEDEKIKFVVYNDKAIPKNIQLQIFQRSFSTKASSGRGIGTYSVKLLVEQYLDGKVGFNSSQESGTNFIIQLPLE